MPVVLWWKLTKEFIRHPSWWFGGWVNHREYLDSIIKEYIEEHRHELN